MSCAGVQKLMMSVKLLLLCMLCRTSLSEGINSTGWLSKSDDLSGVLVSVVDDAVVVCTCCIGSTSLRPGKKGKGGNCLRHGKKEKGG